MFQTIPCYKPRSLTILQSGADTLIAFVDGDSLIRVSFYSIFIVSLFFIRKFLTFQTFVYRGVEGFVEFTSFTLPTYISSMTANSIGSSLDPLLCPENYLVVILEKEVWFLKAITIGHCKIDANIPC